MRPVFSFASFRGGEGDVRIAGSGEPVQIAEDAAQVLPLEVFAVLRVKDDEAAHGRPVGDIAHGVAVRTKRGHRKRPRAEAAAEFPAVEIAYGKGQRYFRGKRPRSGAVFQFLPLW